MDDNVIHKVMTMRRISKSSTLLQQHDSQWCSRTFFLGAIHLRTMAFGFLHANSHLFDSPLWNYFQYHSSVFLQTLAIFINITFICSITQLANVLFIFSRGLHLMLLMTPLFFSFDTSNSLETGSEASQAVAKTGLDTFFRPLTQRFCFFLVSLKNRSATLQPQKIIHMSYPGDVYVVSHLSLAVNLSLPGA